MSKKNTEEPQNERLRLQLEFGPETADRLTKIRALSGCKTNAEAIRNALRIYQWLLEQQHDGYEVQLSKDGTVKVIQFMY